MMSKPKTGLRHLFLNPGEKSECVKTLGNLLEKAKVLENHDGLVWIPTGEEGGVSEGKLSERSSNKLKEKLDESKTHYLLDGKTLREYLIGPSQVEEGMVIEIRWDCTQKSPYEPPCETTLRINVERTRSDGLIDYFKKLVSPLTEETGFFYGMT